MSTGFTRVLGQSTEQHLGSRGRAGLCYLGSCTQLASSTSKGKPIPSDLLTQGSYHCVINQDVNLHCSRNATTHYVGCSSTHPHNTETEGSSCQEILSIRHHRVHKLWGSLVPSSTALLILALRSLLWVSAAARTRPNQQTNQPAPRATGLLYL